MLAIMVGSTRAATLAEEAYLRLRADLLRGDLEPGSRLRINEIAGRYQVSPSVLREALTRLAGQGLVVAMPQRGFAVMGLSIADLQDLTHARRLIETTALRESIADGDLGWESSVLAAHHRLSRTPMMGTDGHLTEDWAQVHVEFHHVLLAGGRSSRLIAAAANLRDCSDLYIHWSRELAHDDHRDAAAEHREIAEFTVARDADRAAEALGRHIERTTAALIEYIQRLGTTASGTAP